VPATPTLDRWRHGAAMVAIGVLPFLVTLYHFYQNVARLLPASS
jgi:hypothetical protein